MKLFICLSCSETVFGTMHDIYGMCLDYTLGSAMSSTLTTRSEGSGLDSSLGFFLNGVCMFSMSVLPQSKDMQSDELKTVRPRIDCTPPSGV